MTNFQNIHSLAVSNGMLRFFTCVRPIATASQAMPHILENLALCQKINEQNKAMVTLTFLAKCQHFPICEQWPAKRWP